MEDRKITRPGASGWCILDLELVAQCSCAKELAAMAEHGCGLETMLSAEEVC
jgi:hypothetical protein